MASRVRTTNKPFEINGEVVKPGEKATLDFSVGSFSTHMSAAMPVRVINGRQAGPVIFVSAAVHGDEIIGVEIIRRLLKSSAIRRLKGTLICIPVVNTFGFINRERYLPDRRDLNRCFPGSAKGSLAGQLAELFTSEILARADFGIDLHSAATHRANSPQIRFSSKSPETRAAALAFGAPIVLESPLREGSLRETAHNLGVDVLLYEAGEALRFDEFAVRVGLKGILNVLKFKGMIGGRTLSEPKKRPVLASGGRWVRSPGSGLFRAFAGLSDRVQEGEVLGMVSDLFGDQDWPVVNPADGIIIGRANLPVVNPGDALFHIGQVKSLRLAEAKIDAIEQDIASDPFFDEDEII